MRSCVFCGSASGKLTDEHAIPKWARRALGGQGELTVLAGKGPVPPREPAGRRLPHLNIVLKGSLREPCNTGWLAGLEKRVAAVLEPMAIAAQPATLDADAQELLAFWAVKTVLLVQLAFRQMYGRRQDLTGYNPTSQELAWLWAERRPPPRSLVWLGAWDCQREGEACRVNFEPSEAPLPTADGVAVAGDMTTFAVGYVVFQVFTVDYIAAEQHGADNWNTRVPRHLSEALTRIWPPLGHDAAWPPPAFRYEDWRQVVTWDGRLRPPKDRQPEASAASS